jgi:hypothetical protein
MFSFVRVWKRNFMNRITSTESTPGSTPATYPPERARTGTLEYSIIASILSLIVTPEIFGTAAIILGAYTWRKERDSNRGLYALIFGIACLYVGLVFTSFFALVDLIPT